ATLIGHCEPGKVPLARTNFVSITASRCLYLLTSCAQLWRAFTVVSLRSWCVFDAPGKQARLNELDKQAAAPDLWSDQSLAQQVMRELSALREELEPWQ